MISWAHFAWAQEIDRIMGLPKARMRAQHALWALGRALSGHHRLFFASKMRLLASFSRQKNYTCAASRNTTDRIMVIRAKHTTIV